MNTRIQVNWPLALLLYSFAMIAGSFVAKQMLEEFAHYVKTGEPHPRKLKAMLKQAKRSGQTQ